MNRIDGPPAHPHAASAYLPQDRRIALAADSAIPDDAVGAVLFTDVTGFTPLAESFAQSLGARRGAEELTALLNQAYTILITQIEAFGGVVMNFSGDAMTCWFDASQTSALPSALLRAIACALAMRGALAAFPAVVTPNGPVALSVKTALAGGSVRRFVLGDPAIQLFDVLVGNTLDRLAASAHLAHRDDIVVDAATLAMLESQITIDAWRSDERTGLCAAVITGLLPTVAPTVRVCPSADLDEARLRPWILPAVYERLRHNAAPFIAELRPAVALMLQFGSMHDTSADLGSQLDQYVRQVQRVVTRYRGCLIDMTMADKGGYLYAAFGAPIAHEDDASSALQAALELRGLVTTPQQSYARIGLSQGLMRVGPYGSPSRCTYGVLGDEVNLACRLMSAAAPGQILVSGRLQRLLGSSFAWQALPRMRVRGKQTAVEVYQLLGESRGKATRASDSSGSTELLGRTNEMRVVGAALEALLAGAGRVIVLEGEPGIGKSRLLAALAQALPEHAVNCLTGAGSSVEQETPYRAWRDLFLAYFGLGDAIAPAEQRAQLVAQARMLVPTMIERLPLLNDLLNLELPDTPLTASLTGGLRSESLGELLVELLRARANQRPLVLVLEDAHWLDSRSWALAGRLAQRLGVEALPVLLVVATRRLDATDRGLPHLQALLAGSGARRLELGQLSFADMSALAAARLGLGGGELPEALARWLHQRASGNPLFAEELIASLRERSLVWIESDSTDPLAAPRCRMATDLEAIDQLLPATLQGLLLARLDALPPEHQLTLKVAAVIGSLFTFPPLLFARNRQSSIDAAGLKHGLRLLAAQDHTALEEPEPNLTYRFKHVLAHEAAYETLLYAQRRALHLSVAEWYERSFAAPAGSSATGALAPYLGLLAHHYRRGESPERERHYSWLAGIQAAEQYANAEAIRFFSRTLELTPEDNLAARYEVLFEREAAEELLALREDQARDLEALEALAEQLDDNRRRAEVARNKARYAERIGDFDAMRRLAARAVALAELAGASELAIRAYDQVAWASMRAGAYEEARRLAEAGLRLARAIAKPNQEAQMLTALGCAYGEAGEFATARNYLEQSRQIFHECGRQRGESVALGNLGEIAARDGDYVVAQSCLEEALRLYQITGDRRNEGWALGNLGMIAMQLGDYQTAARYHQQAHDIARRASDRNTQSLALIDLGLIAYHRADLRLALECAEQARELAGAHFTQIRCLLLYGHALAELSRPAEARTCYLQARELAETTALHARAAEATAGLARLALAGGDLPAARSLIDPLLDLLDGQALNGADEPLRVALTCYQVLAASADTRAALVLARTQLQLEERAARLPDGAVRRAFLHQVPTHRAILAAAADVKPNRNNEPGART